MAASLPADVVARQLDSGASLPSDMPPHLTRDVILENIARAESTERLRRVQFAFKLSTTCSVLNLVWHVATNSHELLDREQHALVSLGVRLALLLLCVLPLLSQEFVFISLCLVGVGGIWGVALADSMGHAMVTGYGLSVSVLYYFGWVWPAVCVGWLRASNARPCLRHALVAYPAAAPHARPSPATPRTTRIRPCTFTRAAWRGWRGCPCTCCSS
jgi:hypothetical protein